MENENPTQTDPPPSSTLQESALEFYNQGISLARLAKYEEALDPFQKAINLNPNDDLFYIEMGIVFEKLGKYQESIDLYQKAIALYPQRDRTHSLMGFSLRKLNQPESAMESYKKAISLNPLSISAYMDMADTLRSLEQYEDAIDHYTIALALNPENVSAYLNRGVAFSQLGKYEEAIENYEIIVSLDPSLPQTYYNMGNSFENLGQYEEAVRNFEKAIQLKPDYVLAHNNRGVNLKNLGRFEEAIESFSKAISLMVNIPLYYCNRAQTYHHLGMDEESLADFNKAAAIFLEQAKGSSFLGDLLGEVAWFRDKAKEIEKRIIEKKAYDGHKKELGRALAFLFAYFLETEAKLRNKKRMAPERLEKLTQRRQQLKEGLGMLRAQMENIEITLDGENSVPFFTMAQACLKLTRKSTFFFAEKNEIQVEKKDKNELIVEYQIAVIDKLVITSQLTIESLQEHLIGYTNLTPEQINTLQVDLGLILDEVQEFGAKSVNVKNKLDVFTRKVKGYEDENSQTASFLSEISSD